MADNKRKLLLKEIKSGLRAKKGLPINRMMKVNGKLHHTSIGIPQGKGLFGPINRVLSMTPTMVHWERCPTAKLVMQDWVQLIQEEALEPTSVHELVVGDPWYKGTIDASGERAGGVWIPASKMLAPIV